MHFCPNFKINVKKGSLLYLKQQAEQHADQNQEAGEVDKDGDQLMLSVADNLTLNSTLPNSRKHENLDRNPQRCGNLKIR